MKLEKLIKENKVDEALVYLQSDSTLSPSLKNYNEAFLHFKKEDFTNARYYLEKAQKLGLYSEETDNALELVKINLGIDTIETSYYKEDSFMFNTIGFHQDVYFSLIGFLLLFTLIFFSKLKHLPGVITLILLTGVTTFYYMTQDHNIKINSQEAVVYTGPSKIFEEKQILLPGMKVITTHETGKWTFIKYPKVFRGWVLNHKAKKL